MTTLWAPERWDDFSIVGLLIAAVVFHFMAYMRGWLVPGRHHREIIDARDRELEQANARSREDAETIRIQAATIAEKNSSEDATVRILAALREVIAK